MTGQIWPLNPAAYSQHALHLRERVWPETNCYVDLWVELLHTMGVEPLAAMPFTFGIDIEGDQWTFLKFPLADLYTLYGVDVFELNVWRPLVVHVEEQLALGRPVLVEVDAFHLPDTVRTSYHAEHVKTAIGIQALDAAGRRLGYFHNAGYYELEGADFAGVFRLEGERPATVHLAPYVEVAKLNPRRPLEGRALVAASLALLGAHLARVPSVNPFRRYLSRLHDDLSRLAGEPLGVFHAYVFATLRQCGAAFECGGAYLRWLQANGEPGLDQLALSCDCIAAAAKTLKFKTARFVGARKRFDPAPLVETMADAWDQTIAELSRRYVSSERRDDERR